MRRSSSRSSPAPRVRAQAGFTPPHSGPGDPPHTRVAEHLPTGPRSVRSRSVGSTARDRESLIVRTAFVSTYTPRRCGIATFTSDLAAVTRDSQVAALHPTGSALTYPRTVRHRIRKQERADYRATAHDLNRSVDVVSIQHEYGIWGGEDGELVLDFVGALRVPSVATLHTVLRAPSPHQRSVLADLVAAAEKTVVMSRAAANLLISVYDVNPSRLQVIPHGVPTVPLVDSSTVKPRLGVRGRDVILSFGLLGPGKGYELAIEALPAIAAAHPDVLYVIAGATHPDLVATQGEAYRDSLKSAIRRLGMERHVAFVDRFLGPDELIRWLQAADVCVTPYPNLGQIVSGTLSYAIGAGRAIVSTPYTYAVELLADGRGVLVQPGSAEALSEGISDLLSDPERRAAIGRRAYASSRRMLWPAVGAEYAALFDAMASGSPAETPMRAGVPVLA